MRTVHIAAKPFAVDLDLHRTALVVIDMQKDFLYPGGYGDMLVQRGEAAAPELRKTAKAPVEKRAKSGTRVNPPKMNFADAHALKVLPGKIAAADLKIAELEKPLSDAGLYARDPARFAKLSADLADIRAQKDADEERWLALEMEREALENQD